MKYQAFDLEELKKHIPLPSLEQFVAGACSGVAQVTAGHPFDTVKTVKHEGFCGLYKGMTAPILGVAFVNSVLFTSNAWFKGLFEKNELELSEVYISGGCAGMVSAFVASPIEMVKIRLQASRTVGNHLTPTQVVQQLLREFGVKGLYRGLDITLIKEFPANAAYYTGFEIAKRQLGKNGDLSIFDYMLSGSFAGVCYWTACYPIDVVKARIQQRSDVSTSMWKNIVDLYKQGGIGAFTRGYKPSLMRTIPSSAATFTVYELLFMGGLYHNEVEKFVTGKHPPKDPMAIAKACYVAAFIYMGLFAFGLCQSGSDLFLSCRRLGIA
ncbi:hypothetical protein HDV04_000352 [Boothiomyces sp. JEL0838]|nr:hypothetical protein HDV04_000352 [Boothiomyces sp. JEL0838]